MTPEACPNPGTPKAAIRSDRATALDGWRAVACLLVLFTHTGFTLGYHPVLVWGFTGVHLFFVLSGYLLFTPFCKAIIDRNPLPDFGWFYLRRWLRIYPPYFLALVVFTVLRYVSNSHPPTGFSFLSHALLI